MLCRRLKGEAGARRPPVLPPQAGRPDRAASRHLPLPLAVGEVLPARQSEAGYSVDEVMTLRRSEPVA